MQTFRKTLLFQRLDFVISAFTAKAGQKQLNPFTVMAKIAFIADYKMQTATMLLSLVHLGFGEVATLCCYSNIYWSLTTYKTEKSPYLSSY